MSNPAQLEDSVQNANKIRIALLPIGSLCSESNESKELLEFYRSVIQQIHSIPISSFSAAQIAQIATAFPQIHRTRSEILIEFVPHSDQIRLKSHWSRLSFHRGILGIIGILFCPKEPNLDIAYENFKAEICSFSDVLRAKCLAFEPLDSQVDDPGRRELIMVPNVGHDRNKLKFYVNTVLIDLVLFILNDFVNIVQGKDSLPFPSTPLDPPSWNGNPMSPAKREDDSEDVDSVFSNSNHISEERPRRSFSISGQPINLITSPRDKKIRSGRLAKIFGDLSMLAGSVEDAITFYQSAIDLLKSAGDFIWRASASESLASAEYLNLRNEDENFDLHIMQKQAVVVKLLKKAYENYGKRDQALSLRVELLFKLAKFVYQAKYDPEKPDEYGKFAASKYLMMAYELCEDLGAQEQISIALEAAAFCQKMGFNRKFGMFIREASLLYCEMYQWSSSLFLSLVAAPAYGLDGLCDILDLNRSTSHIPKLTWVGLQKACMEELMFVASGMKDEFRMSIFLTHFLKLFSPFLAKESQGQLLQKLIASCPPSPMNNRIDMTGLPQITLIQPQVPDSNIIFRRNEDSYLLRFSDPFLFNPNAKKYPKGNRKPLSVSCRELISFTVFLSNPLLVDLKIDSLSLSLGGIECESYPLLGLTIPSRIENFPINLVCKPLEVGNMNVLGVLVSIAGINWLHGVDDFGKGIQMFSFFQQPEMNLNSPEQMYNLQNILVVPECPRALLHLDQPNEKLFVGEIIELHISIENTGSIPIDWIEISYQEKIVKNTEKSQDLYYNQSARTVKEDSIITFVDGFNSDSSPSNSKTQFISHASLNPGKKIYFRAQMKAEIWCCGVTFLCKYGTKDSEMFRELSSDIVFEVIPGLLVKSLNILSFKPTGTSSLVGYESSGTSSRVNSIKDSAFGLESFRPGDCILLMEIENISDCFFRLFCSVEGDDRKSQSGVFIEQHCHQRVIFPTRTLIFGQETFELTLLGLHKESMHDQSCPNPIFQKFKCDFLSRIRLTWQSAKRSFGRLSIPSDKVTPSLLSKVLPNPFEFQFSCRPVWISKSQTFRGRSQSISVSSTPACSRTPSLSPSRASSPTRPRVFRSISLPTLLEKSSANSGIENFGSPFNLSSSFVREGHHITDSSASVFRFPIGEFIELEVRLMNCTSRSLCLDLILRPFEETSAKKLNYDVDEKILIAGSCIRPLPSLGPGQIHTEVIELCMLNIGRYHVEVSCRPSKYQLQEIPFLSSDENYPKANECAITNSSFADLLFVSSYPVIIEATLPKSQ